MRAGALALLLVAFALPANLALAAEPSGPFKTVHCLKYAGLTGKLSMLVVGATPDIEMEHPMVICVAQRAGQPSCSMRVSSTKPTARSGVSPTSRISRTASRTSA